jgi:YD repeat-containing protein
MGYTKSLMGYVNPDAVTQIANGLSTTTFTYDNNGNVTQKTVDGTTTTFIYDYANRLTALGVGGATTTYAYDWATGEKRCRTQIRMEFGCTLKKRARERLSSAQKYRLHGRGRALSI